MLGVGQVIAARYELLERVGEGKLGTVYKGLDREHSTPVAIKIPRPELATNRGFGPRLSREMLTGARLIHPGIARCLEAGQFLDTPFLINEWVDGLAIDVWFRASGQNYEALAELTRQTLEALVFAHGLKILHRELKPTNLMVANDRIRLLDFGMAGRLEDQLGPNDENLAYLSPEQVIGERGDERSDLYSLGAVLYALVAGRPPFEGHSPSEILLAVVNDVPVPLSRLRAAVPVWLDQLCIRLLSKAPARRWQSAAEALTWLKRHRPRAAPEASTSTGPLLDRSIELSTIEQALQLLHTSTGFSIWIDGPPGSGCTRLLDEIERRSPFDCRSLAVPSDRRLRLEDCFALLGGSPLEAVEDLCSQRPLVLIVAGIERADPEVLDLLDKLIDVSERRPLLLVGQSQVSGAPLRSRFAARLSLSALARESCARLVEDRLWAPPPPDSIQWLYRVTGGNPLFIALMLERLEGRHFSIEGGEVRWRAPSERETPASLPALLQMMLEEEGKEAAEVLACGACLGETFEFNLLNAVVLQEVDRLETLLDALVRSSWLEIRWSQGILAYRFPHPCRWQAARDCLGERRQRRIHLLAAAFLERTRPVDFQRLAWQAEQGHEYAGSLRALCALLKLAVDAEQWAEARHWMRRCQRCAVTEALRADRIFPAPWSNFGWTSRHQSTGCHHFLASQLMLLGHSEDATWHLRLAHEEGLEDDPRRQIENHLLWAAFARRGLKLPATELQAHLEAALGLAREHGLEDMLALASALELLS
jgi:serine/threonine protein kinase